MKSRKLRNILSCLLFFIVVPVNAGTSDLILKHREVVFYTPQLLNTKYYGFEFGFVTQKIINYSKYDYNTYVVIDLHEESYMFDENLRAAALGFKGAGLFPTQPWLPLFLNLSIGYSKTVLHKNPFWGRKEQSVQKKDMFLYEVGLLYRYQKFLVRFVYQKNSVKYFRNRTYLSLGVNF